VAVVGVIKIAASLERSLKAIERALGISLAHCIFVI